VEHSIMKRAWPYAVALAVVVTGCYLALTPLLRSLSPGATTSASSISNIQTTATVGQSKIYTIVSSESGKVGSTFVNDLRTKKKAKTTKTTADKTAPPTDTTGFAGGSSSTQAPTKTTTKAKATKTAKKGSGSVGGSVDQSSTGLGGLAGNGNGNGTVPGGTKSDPAGN
jgi:hypothetical protein